MMEPTRRHETWMHFNRLTPRSNLETSRPQPKFPYNTVAWRHVCCVYEIWGYCSGVAEESKFHETSLCVEWWLLSRRFETSVNSTSQHGVTSQKTCISVSKIYFKVIRNFVRILRCSYSSRVCVSTTLMASWNVHCVWNQENVVGMVTAAGSTAKESWFNSR